ncbi:hypothetical protein ACNFCJ_00670 [Pseudomonas sp. NY15364]|uniref:hypothetical protein n=1 Tax=Pseudomonas sp. NY15364 TaxID=3400353 RepID=UPI003A8553D4
MDEIGKLCVGLGLQWCFNRLACPDPLTEIQQPFGYIGAISGGIRALVIPIGPGGVFQIDMTEYVAPA